MKLSLSSSKLDVLIKCDRCFWFAEKQTIKPPKGVFPSLPRGLDAVMKSYFDGFRGELPPEMLGKIDGVLYPDLDRLEIWRVWQKTDMAFEKNYRVTIKGKTDPLIVEVRLSGALDDLIKHPDGRVSPLDYKSKQGRPKTDGSEFYQNQMDIYALMLKSHGFDVTGDGYLIYAWPESWKGPEGEISRSSVVHFGTEVFRLEANPDRAEKTIERAVRILLGNMPAATAGCEYCKYAHDVAMVSDQAVQMTLI